MWVNKATKICTRFSLDEFGHVLNNINIDIRPQMQCSTLINIQLVCSNIGKKIECLTKHHYLFPGAGYMLYWEELIFKIPKKVHEACKYAYHFLLTMIF